MSTHLSPLTKSLVSKQNSMHTFWNPPQLPRLENVYTCTKQLVAPIPPSTPNICQGLTMVVKKICIVTHTSHEDLK